MPASLPKRLKNIALYFLIAIAGIFLAAVIFSFLFSREIKQYVITNINKNIDAEITVGKVDFSILSNFPYASVDFADVIVKEPKRLNTNDTLLEAKEFSLLFNIMDVINKKYVLKKIVLTDASLYLKINKDGENNYEIWKKDSAHSGNDDFKMELEKSEIKNVLVNYKSLKAEQDYTFKIEEGLMEFESAALLQEFFKNKRNKGL